MVSADAIRSQAAQVDEARSSVLVWPGRHVEVAVVAMLRVADQPQHLPVCVARAAGVNFLVDEEI